MYRRFCYFTKLSNGVKFTLCENKCTFPLLHNSKNCVSSWNTAKHNTKCGLDRDCITFPLGLRWLKWIWIVYQNTVFLVLQEHLHSQVHPWCWLKGNMDYLSLCYFLPLVLSLTDNSLWSIVENIYWSKAQVSAPKYQVFIFSKMAIIFSAMDWFCLKTKLKIHMILFTTGQDSLHLG